MLNQVLLIEKNKLSSKILSANIEGNNTKCYALDQLEDFTYLIDDLSPQIMLIEVFTFLDNPQVFWNSVEISTQKNVKLVLFGEVEDITTISEKDKFDLILEKPIQIARLYKQLSSLVE